ncbi:unannotated protein [freshwater metagenome]|uniref:Unannotated protein n=1 Tax=freshwater metagenome TaxID=449393 RepID=A0A6J6BVC9_9ZZZZ
MNDLYSQSNDESTSENNLVEEVKVELNDIDTSDLSEHSARFEALHGKLQEALNTIDGL